mgnify:CR=1 FL=1
MDVYAYADTEVDSDPAAPEADSFPLDQPPRLFGLYELDAFNGSGREVLFYHDAVGWGIEFHDKTITVMRGSDGDWSYGLHESPHAAAALYSLAHPVRIHYV